MQVEVKRLVGFDLHSLGRKKTSNKIYKRADNQPFNDSGDDGDDYDDMLWNDEEDNNPNSTFAPPSPDPWADPSDSRRAGDEAGFADDGGSEQGQVFDEEDYRQTPLATGEDAVSYGPVSRLQGAAVDVHSSEHDDDPEQQGVADLARSFINASTAVRGQSYRSRVEQVLREDPDTNIAITHAGSSHGGRGRGFIVYTIQTADVAVQRRYSEFKSLRESLVRLHPTSIIPPIPEKHSMVDYAANPTGAKDDVEIINKRRRMLAVFLNRCRKMDVIRTDFFWIRFLDPNVSWNEVMNSEPIATMPKNILKVPPLDPANPTPAHSWLVVPPPKTRLRASPSTETPPSPTTATTLPESDLDPYFARSQLSMFRLERSFMGGMEPTSRRLVSHYSALSNDLLSLGARLNAFSLSESVESLSKAIERTGQAADAGAADVAELGEQLSNELAEPIHEAGLLTKVVGDVLRYRMLKRIQVEMTRESLWKQEEILSDLKNSEFQARRLKAKMEALDRGLLPPDSDASVHPDYQEQRPATSVGSGRGAVPEAANKPPRETIWEGDSETQRSKAPDERASFRAFLPHRTTAHPPGPGRSSPKPPRRRGMSLPTNIFGRISHAVQGFVDIHPERSRRDQISRTQERIAQLEQALNVAEKDITDISASVVSELQRDRRDRASDFRSYMIKYAQFHAEWARRNIAAWQEARADIEEIA